MNCSGIIFSNIHDTVMGELTKERTLASLPFGSRYRQIDFVLSCMSNSGINVIGIITKQNYQSLMDHLGSCGEWDFNRKNGGVVILPPFGAGQTDVYKGKIDALKGSRQFIEKSPADHMLLCDSNVLCNIDFSVMLREHKRSGADVTVAAVKDNTSGSCQMSIVSENGVVKEIGLCCPLEKCAFSGMDMYIIGKKLLLELIDEYEAKGRYEFEKDLLQGGFNEGRLKVNMFEFNGVVLRNSDICSYVKNNMSLLKDEIRAGLFKKQAPIYTKVRDEVPTFYGNCARVSNCLIADGCRIEGSVLRSLLSRDVTVQRDAIISDSIIMQGSFVSKGASLSHVIVDKDAYISENTVLRGAEDAPLIIGKGKSV